MNMVWVITNNGNVIDTFATNHSISKDDALEIRGIKCDESTLYYDDVDVRLATEAEEEKWMRE